ncbi:response regulator [Sphingosinicellaceae bacterium]|nr:response regulator [Sphingosinicellaceae bacterium]
MQRVLIVEDEVLIGLVLEDMLDMIGCRVAANAESIVAGFDALERLGAEGFDVAILDVHLGTESVFPLADRLAALGKRIVFATGSHPDTLPERYGDSGVLEKPYAFAAVEALMKPVSAAA